MSYFTLSGVLVPSFTKLASLNSQPHNLNPWPFFLTEVADPPQSAFPFTGGESTALSRLKSYLWDTDHVATYKETRNGMIGSDYSTKFSSW